MPDTTAYTACAHIIPDSVNENIDSEMQINASIFWTVVQRLGFTGKLNGTRINKLYNVITMRDFYHEEFDAMRLWFVPARSRQAKPLQNYSPSRCQRMTKDLSLSGIIDYSIVLRKLEDIGQSKWNVARPKENTRDFGFLKCPSVDKVLSVDYIRGAVTDGMNWKFFLLRLRDDLYLKSNSISLGAGPEYPSRDLIAGLLFHWIKKGRMDLDREDWFTAVPGVPTDKMPAPIRHTVRFRTVRFASLMQAVSVVIIAVLCWVILTTRSQGGTCG